MIPGSRYLFIHDAQPDPAPLRGDIARQWKEIDRGVEYDFYAAASPEDALRHVSLYCDLHPGIDTCFVSCGGDCLTAGVASGLMGAGQGKTLAVYDPGCTNGLARYYDGRDFGNLAKLLSGDLTSIDMIRVNNSYAVNTCTFGLEGLADGSGPGLLQSVSTVLQRSFLSIRITADGAPLDTGAVLFMTIASGKYAPGGLPCALHADNDDGKLELCIVRNMPPTRVMKLLTPFIEGRLEDEPSFADDIIRRKVSSLTVESSKDLTLSADGSPLTGKTFSIRLIPSSVRFVVPAE